MKEKIMSEQRIDQIVSEKARELARERNISVVSAIKTLLKENPKLEKALARETMRYAT